ncbi:MAG: beta-propeller fold lactonase family protein [Candidatus Sulfotelmatobacter sp.]
MTAKVRALLVFALLGATMWLAGCGHYVCKAGFGDTTCSNSTSGNPPGGGNGATQTAFVYTVDDPAGQFAAVGLDVNNSLTFAPVPNFVPPPVFPTKDIDGGLVIVNKKYMYMPVSDGNLYGYSIDATTGALTVLPNTPLKLNLPPYVASPIAADPAGKYLFVGDAAGIYVLNINQNDGSLTVSNGGVPFAGSGLQPVCLATDGAGKYLYVPDGTAITAFSYSSTTGALAPVGGTVTNSEISSAMLFLVGEPSGKYMFGITQQNGAQGTALDNNIYEFTISSTTAPGSLSQLAPTVNAEAPSWLVVSPNGQFLYAFSTNDQAATSQRQPIVLYSLSSATGMLSNPLTNAGFLATRGAIDQNGKYLFIEGESTTVKSAGILALQVASDGTLSTTLPDTGLAGVNMVVTDEP